MNGVILKSNFHKIFAVFALTFLCRIVHAQAKENKLSIGLGASAGITVGVFNTVYSHCLGADVGGAYEVNKNFKITLRGGYTRFSGKKSVPDLGLVPIVAGFNYFIEKKIFISAAAGVAIPTLKNADVLGLFSPGFGYQLSSHLQLLANYIGYAQYGVVIGSAGIGVIYYF